MSEITLEKQLFEIIKNKEMAEHIKLAKLDMLIRLGVDVNSMYGAKSALMFANDKNEQKIAELLKNNGAKDVFDKDEARNLGEKLGVKCENGDGCDIDEVKELIDQGAEIDVVCNGVLIFTSLIGASGNGYTDVVEYLIEKGANINQKDNGGCTALMGAAFCGHKEAVELLIQKGADINQKDNNGCTALMWASSHGYKEIVELLIQNGADVNQKSVYGNNALLWASEHGYKEIVELLIQKGADIHQINRNGETALKRASEHGYKETAELLIQNGADINQKDNDGWTALMWASRRGHKEVVELLIQKGANVNQKNNKGQNALMCTDNGVVRKAIIEAVKTRNIKESGRFIGSIKNLFES